jgi:hypothetical protein
VAREDDFKALMVADTTLMATLTGGVFTSAVVNPQGFSRDEDSPTAGAFDANGWLKPCALVHQRSETPDGFADDPIAKHTSVIQVVEIYLYQDPGGNYSAIDTARARLLQVLVGEKFSNSSEIKLIFTLPRLEDQGTLKGSSLARLDFAVYTVLGF